ncbi:hypothetical protein [Aquimarina brevivitae]|uniref:Uncharacterized protein n=1 Tax=Aquimarina brevivitae TaxID=323412 RepID=A0A4Q7NY23_9FLAO|nr:hypothetical protein [Aquimarina brevivitae]RZS91910.1 hypothetical protein EV197_3014 [Aquimarina brevivitae]
MSKKWCIWTFLTALVLLIAIQERVDAPNQEIILHFQSGDTNTNEVAVTLAAVKEQLALVGIEPVAVVKDEANGIVRIQYYSSQKVEVVKNIFSGKDPIALQHLVYDANDKNNNPIPQDQKDVHDLSISVLEIQPVSGLGNLEFNCIQVPEIKFRTEGNLHTYLWALSGNISLPRPTVLQETKIKINTTFVVNIHERTYSIPQVRAGPLA